MNDPAAALIFEGRFMGTKAPMWKLPKQQPWHRLAALAFARGATAKEVARSLGRSEPAVQNLYRQAWFQEELSAIMIHLGGTKDAMQLLRNETIKSVEKLVEIRDNPRVPAATKVVCIRDILDRALGKPVQRVETANIATSDDPVAEVERLEQEVAHLRKASNDNLFNNRNA
jgi:hypothetical protein